MSNIAAFRTSASELGGGRIMILLLLFVLAIYQFVNAGFSAFAVVCMLPVVVIGVVLAFRHEMLLFWVLMGINYFIQWKSFPVQGIPTSLPNEALELLLIAMAIINVKEARFERCANLMLFMLIIWCSFCTLEVLNDTCGLGIDVGAWYSGARMMSYQLLYALIVYSIYITTPKLLIKYMFVWGGLALFAVFWVWKQQHLGLTQMENAFLQGRGRTTHIINGGATIRLFSIYSDAANYGIGIAATAVAFLISGITCKIKKLKYFFFFVGAACLWGMMPSGTRTATFCVIAGIATYVVLSKSVKIAVPVALFLGLAYFILAFTTIGNGNAQIRRMRSGFNKDDASANQRTINQAVMKKYLADAPFGLGIGMGYENVPANNKFRKLATIPPDSEYVFIWIHTGIVGIIVFLVTTFIMFCGAAKIVMFRLRSPSLRGIGAGMCCAFVAIQLGGYANQVLMQFPNCLLFYGGLSLVYTLPLREDEWIKYEEELFAKQKERERIKLEKKLAKRV
ncbi:MAG: O-antigen ligase family protein [Prevotella sp.]|nr:O-antigen ligase family protein [Prevotella sp.]